MLGDGVRADVPLGRSNPGSEIQHGSPPISHTHMQCAPREADGTQSKLAADQDRIAARGSHVVDDTTARGSQDPPAPTQEITTMTFSW
jgi:hypothetical protein